MHRFFIFFKSNFRKLGRINKESVQKLNLSIKTYTYYDTANYLFN